jgi:hypothetical protein
VLSRTVARLFSITVDGIFFGADEATVAVWIVLISIIGSPVRRYPSNSSTGLKAKREICFLNLCHVGLERDDYEWNYHSPVAFERIGYGSLSRVKRRPGKAPSQGSREIRANKLRGR